MSEIEKQTLDAGASGRAGSTDERSVMALKRARLTLVKAGVEATPEAVTHLALHYLRWGRR